MTFNLGFGSIKNVYRILAIGGEIALQDGPIGYLVDVDVDGSKRHICAKATIAGLTGPAVERVHEIDRYMTEESRAHILALDIVATCREAHNALGPTMLEALKTLYPHLSEVNQLDDLI